MKNYMLIIYRLLMQEENHKKLYENQDSNEVEAMAFSVNKRRFQDNYQEKSRSNGRQNLGGMESKGRYNNYYCEHCKISGRTMQKCYKLHGYRPKFRNGKIAANTQYEKDDQSSESDGNMGFTPSQYQQLLQLLGKDKNVEQSTPNNQEELKYANVAGKLCLLSVVGSRWIVDSGVTDHMCHDLSLFHSYSCIKDHGSTITIPNGKQVYVTYHGVIHLNNDIVLEDVLYVPDFKFNLISIPKICPDMKCNVVFNYLGCTLRGAFDEATAS